MLRLSPSRHGHSREPSGGEGGPGGLYGRSDRVLSQRQRVDEVRDGTYLGPGGVRPANGSGEVEVAYRNLKIDPSVMPPVGLFTPQPVSPGNAEDMNLLRKVLDRAGTR